MKFSDWLDAERGRITALAKHFGVSTGAISQWRTNGVPLSRMPAVADFTAGDVTIEEMVRAAAPVADEVRHAA